MAQGVSINITADASGVDQVTTRLSANLSQAFSGITNQLNQMATASGQASSKMTTGLQGLSQQVIKQVAVQGDLSKSFLQTGQAAQTQLNQFEKLRQEYLKTQQATDQFAKGLSLIRTTLSAFGVTAGIAGVIQFTKSIVEAGIAQENLMLSLKGATGSTLAAGEAYTFVRKVATDLGLDIVTAAQGFAKLTAATKDTALQGQQTRDLFIAMSQASRVMGLSTAEVSGVMAALTQIIGKNTVSMEELRQQLGERLPQVLRLTAKEMGKTTAEFIAMVSKGELLATETIPAMTLALARIGEEAPSAAASAVSALNRMGNAWNDLKIAIAGSGVLDAIAAIAERATVAANAIGRAIRGRQNLQGTERLEANTAELQKQQNILKQMEDAPGVFRPELIDDVRQRISILNADIASTGKLLKDNAAEEESIAQGLAKSGKRDAQIKALQDEKKGFAALKAEIAAVDKQLDAIRSKDPDLLKAAGIATAQELKVRTDELLGERQKLVDRLEGIDRAGAARASKTAESEAKRRAAIEQQAMEQSLKTQEALIAESFDERRRLIDVKFSEDLDREPFRVKELAALRSAALQAATVEEARFIEQVRIESLSRQMLTEEEFAAKREAIIKRTGEVELRVSQQTLQQQVKDAEDLVSLTERVNEQILDRDEKMQAERTRILERELDEQQRAYERFSEQVVGFLDSIFQGLLSGTLNAVDFFKQLLIRQLSNIAANVLGPLVTSISSALVGGIAGMLPGGLGGVVQGALGLAGVARTASSGLGLGEGVGLLGSMRTIAGAFTTGLSGLTDALINAGATISTFFGGPTLATEVSGVTLGPGILDVSAGSAAGTALGAAGGLAALGGGIYAAINASNAASRAAFAASAAAGAAATATAAIAAGLLGASAATAVGTGWTGVGLIVAAVMAVIGVVLDKVIKPAGPSLSVRAGGGLGIGVQDGKLAVEGGVGSRATRREGVDRELANTVAQQLDEGITNAVKSIVQTINAVALDPAALLGPTQAALQQTLRNLQPINSANAKKMEKDIQEQLRFANLAIVGGLLEPVNLAFDQLRDQGDLKEQLDRLPGTTAGLVAVFKTMNQQLDEIAKVENTDVLRQLSGVRNQVENFGNRISGTAGQIAESIVNQLVDQLVAAGSAGIEQIRLDPSARFNKIGKSVDDLDRSLAEQITDFSEMMQTSVRAITILRNTKDILEQSGLGGGAVGRQIDRLAMATGDAAGRISKQIVTTALTSLAADVDQLLLRPLQLQAVGVNSLFNDGLATLAALQVQWNQLSALGIDTKGLQEQFSRLLGGLLESAMTVLNQAFAGGTFAEFLSVLVSIPDDLARLNPELARLKQLGLIFAQVVAPMDQAIMTLEDSLLTTAERVTFTETRMADLRSAIADAGNAVDQALPLYAALSEAIQANAAAQIASVNEVADAQIKAAQESADVQIQAVHDAADAHIEWINTVADAQIAAINASSDALTEGVSAYFDAAAEQLRQFVEELTTAINTWADVANTTAGQLRTVNETILAEQSPAAQQRALREQEARLLAMVTGGGAGSQAALSELISVEQQLLALAKRSNNLKAQQDSLDKLAAIQQALREQLVALTGQSDPIIAQIVIAEVQKEYLKQIADFNTAYSRYLETTQGAYLKAIADQTAAMVAGVEAGRTSQIEAVNASATAQILSIETARDAQVNAINESRDAMITAIKVDVINQLKALEGALQHLFEGQDVVNGTLHVPFTVRVAPAGAYAQGGMVGAMLEPGERVWTSPLGMGQQRALVAMNTAFPRYASGGFTVPGRGTGDTVPMMLPRGSFVMNRRAAGAMGYQGGGMVSGSMGSIVINVDLRGSTVRSPADVTRLTTEFREAVREALREIERRSPKRGG